MSSVGGFYGVVGQDSPGEEFNWGGSEGELERRWK